MATISTSNCLYLDRQDANGTGTDRTYEAFEVDKETRRRDCRICLHTFGLATVIVLFALIYLGIIHFDWFHNGPWAFTFRSALYAVFALLIVIFIYFIAKVIDQLKLITKTLFLPKKNFNFSLSN